MVLEAATAPAGAGNTVTAEATGAIQLLPMDATGEMDMLKADANYMQKSLDAIKKRIDELSVKPAEVS